MASAFCFGQTQGEINDKAVKNYKMADKELNSVYQTVLKQYSDDTAFIKNFKNAQTLWIQFRDAEMKAKYPEREQSYYGSTQPMCWYSYMTELTGERTRKLKIWLTGIAEGDLCAGSVKTRN
jgi:uncharacterized protein YecT (DUF1311 family)